ncbi:chemotaxis response regulator protein-glutamate methylesterase [bacterium]|nr:chemotaxis response regulator protein-glutamate methylesterase [bacterium]
MEEKNKIRVLIVDDSAFMRTAIERMLKEDPEIEIIGSAANGKEAIEKNLRLKPDVVTLDVEMPIMDGLHALKEIMKLRPVPVIMVSSMTKEGAKVTLDALELGALDFIGKPGSTLSLNILDIRNDLIRKVRVAAHSEPRAEKIKLGKITSKPTLLSNEQGTFIDWIVLIGASTGGPPAILNVLTGLPGNLPAPIVIAQHMPRSFTNAFAQRLNSLCNLRVKEASDGEVIQRSLVYICPGDTQTRIKRRDDNRLILSVSPGKAANEKFAPSVDVLFLSAAEILSPKIIGVILTGMGEDGVKGLKNIKLLGGLTLAQDKSTSVVYGMPRAALEDGAVTRTLPIQDISQEIELALR